MDASTRWINDYLDRPASAEEQAELLTRAGFPLEGREDLDNGDICQDFEMTSNRGDCVCHLGLAREIAAISQRQLKIPEAAPCANGPSVSNFISVTNHEREQCPIYTGRVVRGVKVGPSPKWLTDRLTAISLIPRNNLVDLTNFVLFEWGQPTHVFDLNTLRGNQIMIRMAHKDEPFLPIGEGAQIVKLAANDLVIADAERAVAIAGVKGGAETAVTTDTTGIFIEAATFSPVTVRNTSRRLNIASDSSYRFERGVHPAQVNVAADRLTSLILEVCGGELCEGIASDGAPIPAARMVSMRTDRCRKVIGIDISDQQMIEWLSRLGFEPQPQGDVISCTVPYHRLDIVREIDLIEEVSRMFGLDNIPIDETIRIRVAPPQSTELAKRAVNDALVGMGYVETVTHSLIGEKSAIPFLPEGHSFLRVEDDRAGSEPILRPSILPSLLRVRAHNLNQGVSDLRLFETASTFSTTTNGHEERVRLGLLEDAGDDADGLRSICGAAERLVSLLTGVGDGIDVEPLPDHAWLSPAANIIHDRQTLGVLGMVKPSLAAAFEIDIPVLAGELDLPWLYDAYPPDTEAHALPAFPAIERDLSLVVDEGTRWRDIRQSVNSLTLEFLESIEFIATFRSKQIGSGRKSLTLRTRFRSPDRTLTREEADGWMAQVIDRLKNQFKAELRG